MAISPERLEQIQTLYLAALDLPVDERTAFLDEACSGDAGLRREVASLLDADVDADSFLERPLADVRVMATPLVDETPALGQQIGPYRVLEEIGRGGMGTVYLAERDDGQFEQRVALKVIRRGFYTEEVERRFLQERQILARLQHPHVARLYDGGVDASGRPFFAMEHVVGEPLTTYCDRRRLGVEARLRLFRQVGEAVQFAHRQLIVHRDLKPSNILVTEAGRVKLLDFGIAKLLGDDAAELLHTQTGLHVMTPEYAAPEQVRGEPVSTSTDVYALGVVLYELLTGHRPYRTERHTAGALEAAILGQEPVRPSTAVTRPGSPHQGNVSRTSEQISAMRGTTPALLRKRLTGDLDTIILKALRKEPERRYASVEAFAEDVRRYLGGLPVTARPDTLSYRTGKFVRRNRWQVAAGGAIAGLLLVAVVVTLRSNAQVSAALAQARLETAKAEESAGFLRSLFALTDPYAPGSPADSLTARDLLDRGAARLGNDLHDQPEVRAMLMGEIGRIYHNMSLPYSADSLLKATLALQRQALPATHPDIATTLHELSRVKDWLGDYEASEQLAREAFAMRRTLFGEQHPDVAQSMDWLGSVLGYKGDYAEAESLSYRAVALFETLADEGDEAALRALHNLAWLLDEQGRYDEAEPVYRRTITLAEKYHPGNLENGITISNFAAMLRRKGDLDEAERFYYKALALQQTHSNTPPLQLGITLNNLGKLFQEKNQLDEAATNYEEALAILTEAFGRENTNVSVVLNNLGMVEHRRGRFARAERLQREALSMQRRLLPDGHSYLASTLVALGHLLIDTGRAGKAESLLREALASREQQYEASHWIVAEAQVLLGVALVAQTRFDEAEALLQPGYAVVLHEKGTAHYLTRLAQEALDALAVNRSS